MKRIHWALLAAVTVGSVIGQISAQDFHHWWDMIPGFYAIYGFVGCIVIIKVSKWFGKRVLFRDEEYYDR